MPFLPDELLVHIFEYDLSQNDLVTLSRVGKKLYLSARDQLYGNVYLQDSISLHLLMRSILSSPFLASLVRTVVLGSPLLIDGCPEELEEPPRKARKPYSSGVGLNPFKAMYSPEEIRKLQELAGNSGLGWQLQVLPIGQCLEHTAILLFRSLPRLWSLTLCQEVISQVSILDVKNVSHVFPMLHTFTYGSISYTRPIYIEALLPVFFIPTIRTITIWSLETEIWGELQAEDMLKPFYRTSSVETLHIYKGDMDVITALTDMLRLPKCLKELQCGPIMIGGTHQFVNPTLLRLIIDLVSDTLERLVIHHTYLLDTAQMGSLRSYSSLKRLVITPHILFGSSYSGFIEPSAVLPSTLEHFSLMAGSLAWSLHHYIVLIRSLIEQKSVYFPRLRVVVLWMMSGAVPEMQQLQELASKAEVVLGIAHDYNPDPFQVIPLGLLQHGRGCFFSKRFSYAF